MSVFGQARQSGEFRSRWLRWLNFAQRLKRSPDPCAKRVEVILNLRAEIMTPVLLLPSPGGDWSGYCRFCSVIGFSGEPELIADAFVGQRLSRQLAS